jgi:hypothetical protein
MAIAKPLPWDPNDPTCPGCLSGIGPGPIDPVDPILDPREPIRLTPETIA